MANLFVFLRIEYSMAKLRYKLAETQIESPSKYE